MKGTPHERPKPLKAALSHLEIDENPISVRAKSRDFFWYSPVLKARMDHLTADFVVSPRSEAEVIEVLRAAHAHDVPVTVRGAGTGNYGQAIPLKGGIILHLNKMKAVKGDPRRGAVIVGAGLSCSKIWMPPPARIRGRNCECSPATWRHGHDRRLHRRRLGRRGLVHWGGLRDLGNIIRLRVVTMEAEPRVLEFTGEELHRVSHAYGTNGIITEIEMPLAPAYDWVGIFVSLRRLCRCRALRCRGWAHQDGILKKLISVYEAPITERFISRVAPHVAAAGQPLVGLMVAPHAMDGFLTFIAPQPGGAGDLSLATMTTGTEDRGPVFEYGWNHTTLRALKVDPSITYLQVRYATADHMAKVARDPRGLPGER
ncbi:MAG: FAD-binding protein [Gemmobacter sp.]|nr:FAD-binding protein [Gemmobacter sp.]